MKVKDLIVLLQQQDPEEDIVCPEPSDGNGPISKCEPELIRARYRTKTHPCACMWGALRIQHGDKFWHHMKNVKGYRCELCDAGLIWEYEEKLTLGGWL